MPQEDSGTGPALRGRALVEPPGYAISSFLTAAALTIGIGLAPRGLLLFAAAVIGSVIELRRLRAANPWFSLETPDDFRTREGKLYLRYSAWGTGVMVAMSMLALVLVNSTPDPTDQVRLVGDDAAAIGPGLIAGVAALLVNYLFKRAIAKPPAPGDSDARMGGDPPEDERDPEAEPIRAIGGIPLPERRKRKPAATTKPSAEEKRASKAKRASDAKADAKAKAKRESESDADDASWSKSRWHADADAEGDPPLPEQPGDPEIEIG